MLLFINIECDDYYYRSNCKPYVKKFSNNQLVLDKQFQLESNETSFLVNPTKDNGFFATILKKNGSTTEYFIAKYNSSAQLQWKKKTDSFAVPNETLDGGFILIDRNYSGVKAYVANYSANGELIWKNIFDNKDYELATPLVETQDGGFAAVAIVSDVNNTNIAPFLLVKYNQKGELVLTKPEEYWKQRTNIEYTSFSSLFLNQKGEFALVGHSWVFKDGIIKDGIVQGVTLTDENFADFTFIKILQFPVEQIPVEQIPVKQIPVKQIPVEQISLNKSSITLNLNKTFQLNVSFTPNNSSNKNLTWSSSNPKVATVSATGLIRAVGKGTTKINVTSKDGNISQSVKVTVQIPSKK